MKSEENKNKSRYTKEFKDSILKLAGESKEPLVKIANDVGVHPKTDHATFFRTEKLESFLGC